MQGNTNLIQGWSSAGLNHITKILGLSFLIALFAPVAFPLPFSPIPIGTQNTVCLAIAALFGPRVAFLAVMAFIVEGFMGLPIFAGCHTGVALIASPKFGYVVGYALSTLATGYLVFNRKWTAPLALFSALMIGVAVQYVCGVTWLSGFIGPQKALLLGVAPFIAGDLLKCLMVSQIVRLFKRT